MDKRRTADNPLYIEYLQTRKDRALTPEELLVLSEYQQRILKEDGAPSSQDEPESNNHSLENVYQSLVEEYMQKERSQPMAATEPATVASDPSGRTSRDAADAVEEAVSSGVNERELRQECPFYIINKALANSRSITSTERCCLGLLNTLMQKHGYAYATNEQLALWLCMKSPDSVRNMMAKLCRRGFVRDTGRRKLQVRWVVREDLQNPKKGAHL